MNTFKTKSLNITKLKKYIIFVLIAMIALLTIINYEYIIEIMPAVKTAEYTITSDETRSYTTFRNYVLLYDRSGIVAIDKSGKEKWRVSETLDIPIVAVSENDIVVAAAGGTIIHKIDKSGKYESFITDYPILNLKVSDNGLILALMDRKLYNSGVTVFDTEGTELFSWWAGENRIMDADITPNRRLAVTSLITENNKISTEIAYFNLNKSSEKYVTKKYNEFVNCVKWLNKDRLAVVCEKSVKVLDANGKIKWEKNFGDNIINYYNIDNNKNLVFLSGGGTHDKHMNVMSCNAGGRVNGEFVYDGEITGIKANNDSILFISNDKLVLSGKNGKRTRTSDMAITPYAACLFQTGNKVFADCGNSAKLFYCHTAIRKGDNNGT